jgi:hypothetical protein
MISKTARLPMLRVRRGRTNSRDVSVKGCPDRCNAGSNVRACGVRSAPMYPDFIQNQASTLRPDEHSPHNPLIGLTISSMTKMLDRNGINPYDLASTMKSMAKDARARSIRNVKGKACPGLRGLIGVEAQR